MSETRRMYLAGELRKTKELDDFINFIDNTARDALSKIPENGIAALREETNPAMHHFGVGMWVRNNYLWQEEDVLRFGMHPDSLSAEIVERMIEILQEESGIAERCRKLPLLTTRKVKWHRGEKLDDGSIQFGFPQYDEETRAWVEALYDLDLTDKNYDIKRLEGKEIESYTMDEVLTHMTWIIRMERFGDGHIASALEDGTIEKLGRRLREVIEQ